MPNFDNAVNAYAGYCEEQNLIFQQPSTLVSEERNGIVYLRNTYGSLARYSIKQGRIL